MAKQVGPYFIKGCIGNLCFYELDGQYYVRMKSSLDGERVKKDPAFRGLMWYAEMQGKASKLASRVNRELVSGKKIKSLFKPLKTEAYRLLREGINAEEVLYLLRVGCGLVEPEVDKKVDRLKSLQVEKECFTERVLNDLFDDGNEILVEIGNRVPP